jgi:hypothetical protein
MAIVKNNEKIADLVEKWIGKHVKHVKDQDDGSHHH